MRRLVAPRATWTFPGDARISGTARGIDAIIAKATAITSGGVIIEVQHVLAGSTVGAVAALRRARRAGHRSRHPGAVHGAAERDPG